jgi:hypothetical protein
MNNALDTPVLVMGVFSSGDELSITLVMSIRVGGRGRWVGTSKKSTANLKLQVTGNLENGRKVGNNQNFHH